MDHEYIFTNDPLSPAQPRFDHLLHYISTVQWTEKFSDLRILVSLFLNYEHEVDHADILCKISVQSTS